MLQFIIPIIQILVALPGMVISCSELVEMIERQINLYIQCVNDIRYIKEDLLIRDGTTRGIPVVPKRYEQSNLSPIDHVESKNVLIAMKFGANTLKLREAIKRGIIDAGYNPILIDEVEHNNQVTAELLKCIEESRFVVVDLSHQNNGAYFEEGYAMGLGKTVIQLCKNGVELHFDIAQKNTIIWEEESDIPKRLKKRILATIE